MKAACNRHTVLPIFFSTVILLLLTHGILYAQHLDVANLRCEYRSNPAGIAVATPMLSWQLVSDRQNIVQVAYRILVADNQELLAKNTGNIWDSKKVKSNISTGVAYAGQPLESARTYYWKLLVWDNQGQVSTWSKPAYWQMGLLTKEDWKDAQWIAYEKMPDSRVAVLPPSNAKDKGQKNNVLPLLRKEFFLSKELAKATVFISGLGQFDMHLNGQKIGDHFLDPGWTKYDKEALYLTFDITQEIRPGKNALGVLLGNGFYNIPAVKGRYRKLKVAFGYPKMISRLFLEYKDGSFDNIVSDSSWKVAPGPITFSSIYGGEDYDANKEQSGWDTPEFDDGAWRQALLVDGPPALNPQQIAPLKIFETFLPVKLTVLQSGEAVYDFGQNASGIISLRVKGVKGDTVRIYPGELLDAEGAVTQKPTGSPFYFQYILKGEGEEVWQPRFSYYGFRYAQVKGAIPLSGNHYVQEDGRKTNHANEGRPPTYILEIKSLHTRNAASVAGEFYTSDTLFNRINDLIGWAIKSNMASVFTDCPHREKLGWLEEVHLMGNSIRYNYDIAVMGRKVINDMMHSQLPDGLVPAIAPEYVQFVWGGDMFRDSPEWGSTSIILPWYLYEWYGDIQALTMAYPMMQRYIKYLQKMSRDHILTQGLGDWYDLGPDPPGVSQLTPMGITATAIYYYDLTILEKTTLLLGKRKEAKIYGQLADEVKNAFNREFFNKDSCQYGNGSQTANAMAIYMGLVEPRYRKAVVENLVEDIKRRNYALTAGDIGYRYLLQVLEQEGRSDVIYLMNSRTDVPGYGYQLARGATALTESWQALPSVSNNHLMLGHLMEWFYEGLCGIGQESGSLAFSHIRIHPEPVGNIEMARASWQSPYGGIESHWKNRKGVFELDVTIPPNSEATIYVPAKEGQPVYLNGELVRKLSYKNGRAIIKTGSGSYQFKSTIP